MPNIIPHIHFNGNTEEAEHLFNGLSAGGAVEMPTDDSPWGAFLGTFRDKYGVEWMVEFANIKENQSTKFRYFQ